MSVVGKHVLTGKDVGMTRRLRDGVLLFTVVDYDGPPAGGIVLEIDPRKLKGAFGPRGIVVPDATVKEAILTHRECGCPISGEGGTILPCVCPPLVQHAFVSMLKSTAYLPNERCLQCAEPQARHRDWRCELHDADPCAICHPPRKGAARDGAGRTGAKCGESYDADPKRLALGNRLCDECASRPRSTCHDYGPPHAAHNWEHGTAKLWCPGTDGGNPQVPDDLAKKLRASPTGRLKFPSEPELQNLSGENSDTL